MGSRWRRFRARLRAWRRRHDASRQMPPPLGRWPSYDLPVVLWLHPQLEPAHWEAVADAVRWWHSQTGRHLLDARGMREADAVSLAIGHDPPHGHAVITSAAPLVDAAATTRTSVYEGRLQWAEVRLRPGLRGERLTRACRHELGHVLGLHDHRRGGDERLLMDPGGSGCELMPGELAHVRG